MYRYGSRSWRRCRMPPPEPPLPPAPIIPVRPPLQCNGMRSWEAVTCNKKVEEVRIKVEKKIKIVEKVIEKVTVSCQAQFKATLCGGTICSTLPMNCRSDCYTSQ